MVKNLLAMQETGTQSLGWEDPPEKAMATHSSILAWRLPWTEEPAGGYNLQSMAGSQGLRHNGTANKNTLLYTREVITTQNTYLSARFTSLCIRICTLSALVNGDFHVDIFLE